MVKIAINYNDARMILKEALLYEEFLHQATHAGFIRRLYSNKERQRLKYYQRELMRVRSAINDLAEEIRLEFGKT